GGWRALHDGAGGGRHGRAYAQPQERQAEGLQGLGRIVPEQIGAHAQARQRQGAGQQARAADPGQQLAGQRSGQQGGQGQRDDGQAGFQRREAQHQLQALAENQLHADQGGGGGQGRHDRGREGGIAKQREIDQRMQAAALLACEQGQEQHAGGQRGGSQRPGGRLLAGFLDGEGAGYQSHHDDQGSFQVPGARGVGARARHQQQSQRQGEQHDGHIDQEYRAPPEMLQKQPADHRTKGGAARGDRSPDADGDGALALVRKGDADQRQGGRHHHGR